MRIFDKGFGEILSSQVLSVIGGLVAGTLLAIYTDKLFLIPGMLIIFPAFLDMRGNISGTLASRLSSGLYLKVINPGKVNSRIVRSNMIASFLLALAVSFFLGMVAFAINFLLLGAPTPEIILIPVMAGIIASAIEIPLTAIMTLYLFRKGHDPDNIMGPLVTSTGDISSIVALLIAVVLI